MIALITCIVITITIFCIVEMKDGGSAYGACFGLGALSGLLIWLGVMLVGGISVGIINDTDPDSMIVEIDTVNLCPLGYYDSSYDDYIYLEQFESANAVRYYRYCVEIDGSYFLKTISCGDATISYLKDGYDPAYTHVWRDAPNELWRAFSADFAPDDHIFRIPKGSILISN